MTRESILAALRSTASDNGGRPLGARAFQDATSINRTDLWNAGFATYSDAVRAAGLTPNTLMAARDTNAMLASLAALTKKLGRFPTIGTLKVARRTDATLPSYEAFLRLAGGAWSDLPGVLLGFCRSTAEYTDLVPFLEAAQPAAAVPTQDGLRSKRLVGYVYLAKHGRDYKIGRSNDVARRRREVSLLLPTDLEHVHVIETDDPEGIESYWHRRFADRRIRGEWFRLTAVDVAAFKRRKYQ